MIPDPQGPHYSQQHVLGNSEIARIFFVPPASPIFPVILPQSLRRGLLSHQVIHVWWQMKALCFGDLLLLTKGRRLEEWMSEAGSRKDLEDKLSSWNHTWRQAIALSNMSYCCLKRNDKISDVGWSRVLLLEILMKYFSYHGASPLVQSSSSQGTRRMCALLRDGNQRTPSINSSFFP